MTETSRPLFIIEYISDVVLDGFIIYRLLIKVVQLEIMSNHAQTKHYISGGSHHVLTMRKCLP